MAEFAREVNSVNDTARKSRHHSWEESNNEEGKPKPTKNRRLPHCSVPVSLPVYCRLQCCFLPIELLRKTNRARTCFASAAYLLLYPGREEVGKQMTTGANILNSDDKLPKWAWEFRLDVKRSGKPVLTHS